jgi:hypothetical protein
MMTIRSPALGGYFELELPRGDGEYPRHAALLSWVAHCSFSWVRTGSWISEGTHPLARFAPELGNLWLRREVQRPLQGTCPLSSSIRPQRSDTLENVVYLSPLRKQRGRLPDVRMKKFCLDAK